MLPREYTKKRKEPFDGVEYTYVIYLVLNNIYNAKKMPRAGNSRSFSKWQTNRR